MTLKGIGAQIGLTAVSLLVFTGCGSPLIADLDGRILPPVGSEARFQIKDGVLAIAKDKAALKELASPAYKVEMGQPSKEIIKQFLMDRYVRMLQEGKLYNADPGTKIRVLEYLKSDLEPVPAGYKGAAFYAKFEFLDSAGVRQVGFGCADAIE